MKNKTCLWCGKEISIDRSSGMPVHAELTEGLNGWYCFQSEDLRMFTATGSSIGYEYLKTLGWCIEETVRDIKMVINDKTDQMIEEVVFRTIVVPQMNEWFAQFNLTRREIREFFILLKEENNG
jgi:hypothetical protein